MSKRQDEIANKAVRKATIKNLKVKKNSRLAQLKADYEKQVRDINIQFAEDPERLKAKYASADYAKSEKARKRAEKRIAQEKEKIAFENSMRQPTMAESVASSIVQGIGCALSIAGLAILDTIAIQKAQDFVSLTTVFFSLFGAAMILMYLFSVLQHSIPNYVAKKVFNRLSHVFAFLNIGFCYSVFTITKLQGLYGWILFGVVWALALIGIIFYSISGHKHDKVNAILYIIAGFSGIVLAKVLFNVIPVQSFSMLMFAAACFVFGIFFYNLRKIKYMHFIGNILMLGGSVFVFFALLFMNF